MPLEQDRSLDPLAAVQRATTVPRMSPHPKYEIMKSYHNDARNVSKMPSNSVYDTLEIENIMECLMSI